MMATHGFAIRNLTMSFVSIFASCLIYAQQVSIPRDIQPGQTWLDPMLNIEFQYCPPGSFQMGSSADYFYRVDDQMPQHLVTISHGFLLSKEEITQATWKTIMGNNPAEWIGDDHSVEMISWFDCQQFVNKLNEKIGFNVYRLPTEAEWEYACRAGESSSVDETKSNAWGLQEMLGSVREWCSDWRGPYLSQPQTDPQGPSSGKYRINRGGSFMVKPKFRRSEYRWYYTPDFKDNDLGLRLLRVIN